MTTALWLWIAAGTTLVIGSVVAFLVSLAHGLRTGRWWPVMAIVFVWMMGMVGYSMWDGHERQQAARERASELEDGL